MILETMGIGLVIPFMQTLIDDEINQHLLKFLNYFNIYPTSKYNLIFILISVLAIVYTIKASFLTYVSYAQTKLFADTRVSLSNRLYDIYLNPHQSTSFDIYTIPQPGSYYPINLVFQSEDH